MSRNYGQFLQGNIEAGQIYHTMGYPLNNDEFGGGFIYGLNDNKVAVGLVVGLDYKDPSFDVHDAFQIWKTTPFVSQYTKRRKNGWNMAPRHFPKEVIMLFPNYMLTML